MKVTALRSFAHDAYRAEAGDELEMNEQTAADLEKFGFVTREVKMAPELQNKMAVDSINKGKK